MECAAVALITKPNFTYEIHYNLYVEFIIREKKNEHREMLQKSIT